MDIAYRDKKVVSVFVRFHYASIRLSGIALFYKFSHALFWASTAFRLVGTALI
jgi:hypothetical protein